MKCFLLAGGTGNRLWPISRKNYPKQFIELHDGRSLFQETIVRNMPLCDEFYIFVNEQYINIAKGQLFYFRDLKYKLFVETEQLKTALPILIAALTCPSEENILIVSADAMIGQGNYMGSVTEAKKFASAGFLTLITVPVKEIRKEYKYIRCNGDKIERFVEDFSQIDPNKLDEYRYDIGVSVNRADVLLNQFRKESPEMFYKTQEIIRLRNYGGDEILLNDRDFEDVPKLSLGKALNLNSDVARNVLADFPWDCCFSLETFSGEGMNQNIIVSDSKNVSVINSDKEKLVVVNRLENAVVVNTKNAVYVSAKDHSSDIKQIIKQNRDRYGYFFDESQIFYQPWGIKEYLSRGKGYRITKMTIFPGKFLQEHFHENRSEHWSIVSGSANIRIGEDCRNYGTGESAFAACGVVHRVGNITEENAVLIETALEPSFEGLPLEEIRFFGEAFFPLEPAYKDYFWGGTKIKDYFNKKSDFPIVAESWEISAHPAGQSVVKKGEYAGYTLGMLLSKLGKKCLGWKSEAFDRFPLLVKFIDAHKSLSIQVHPDDDYALMAENEYGKNEMWYIMDCEEDSYLYLGFNRDVTLEEVRRRIHDNTLTEILNKVPVKKGDCFFIAAGTVHAIGAGILLCEVQQNSNCTYRLYDFGRKDRDGRERALHIDKALNVLNFSKMEIDGSPKGKIEKGEGYESMLLCECKYFVVEKYSVVSECTLYLDASSFAGVVILSGGGEIRVQSTSQKFNRGDSFFFPAQKIPVHIVGECEFIRIGL